MIPRRPVLASMLAGGRIFTRNPRPSARCCTSDSLTSRECAPQKQRQTGKVYANLQNITHHFTWDTPKIAGFESSDFDSETTVIGIDPDANGALAVLRLPGTALPPKDVPPMEFFSRAPEVRIYDMPIETVLLSKRARKQPCPRELFELIAGLKATHDSTTGIHAVLEHTTPGILSGKYAWYGSGYATGLLTGLLHSQCITLTRVSAVGWKQSLGLTKLGKEGSLLMVRTLFPQLSNQYFGRKKDHGRAEALLLAAWGLGLKATPVTVQDEPELPPFN
jgi:hypothetical protein